MQYSAEQIARVCHDANKALCEAQGDFSQFSYDEAPNWQKESAIKGVDFVLAGNRDPEAQHESWMKEKVEAGWVYGEVKDAEAKTHPCLVEYDELPEPQRRKDFLFLAVVLSLSVPMSLDEKKSDAESRADGSVDNSNLDVCTDVESQPIADKIMVPLLIEPYTPEQIETIRKEMEAGNDEDFAKKIEELLAKDDQAEGLGKLFDLARAKYEYLLAALQAPAGENYVAPDAGYADEKDEDKGKDTSDNDAHSAAELDFNNADSRLGQMDRANDETALNQTIDYAENGKIAYDGNDLKAAIQDGGLEGQNADQEKSDPDAGAGAIKDKLKKPLKFKKGSGNVG